MKASENVSNFLFRMDSFQSSLLFLAQEGKHLESLEKRPTSYLVDPKKNITEIDEEWGDRMFFFAVLGSYLV